MELTVNLLGDGDGSAEDEVDSQNNTQIGMGMEIQRYAATVKGRPDLVLPFIPKLLCYMSSAIESESRRIKAGNETRNFHSEFTVISK